MKSTPMHLVAKAGDPVAIKTLKEFGADVSAKDEYGSTPLHVAVENGKIENVKMLLALGAKVNVKEKYTQETPLRTAASKIYFAKYTMDAYREGKKTRLEFEEAQREHKIHTSIMEMLRQKGAK